MKNASVRLISIPIGLLVLVCNSLGGPTDGTPKQIVASASASPASFPAPNFLKHNDDFQKPSNTKKSKISKTAITEPKTIQIAFIPADDKGEVYLVYRTIDLNGIAGRWKGKDAKTCENNRSSLLSTTFSNNGHLTVTPLSGGELELSGLDAKNHNHRWVTSQNVYCGDDDINWKAKWWPW